MAAAGNSSIAHGSRNGSQNAIRSQTASPSGGPPNSSSTAATTAGLHSLPAIAQLLNAHKVYRAGYLWRLDNDPSASASTSHAASSSHNRAASGSSLSASVNRPSGAMASSSSATPSPEGPRFVRYYMRLEDCILCVWPDEGLKRAQAQGTVIHPTSMNLTDGFAALASSRPEWISRCNDSDAPTPYCFVLNSAGNNSIVFCTDDEQDMRRWINAIRLSIWEHARLETMFTAARLGIKEEQQGQPIRSALALTNNGAKLGRAEALLDVRLPGDTEWRQVYAVLTEPGNYAAHKDAPATSAPLPSVPSSPNRGNVNNASSVSSKKDKRKSFLGLLTGSSSSKHDNHSKDGGSQASHHTQSATPDYADSSPVISSYNAQLEDPRSGPTLALFGILSNLTPRSASQSSPHSRSNSTEFGSLSASAGAGGAGAAIPVKLTKRPIAIMSEVYSAYAVWPESEALVPHSKLFKIHGRMWYNESELASYVNAPGVHGSKGPMSPFMDALRRENRDGGRTDGQAQLLCMHSGHGNELVGPGNAIRRAFFGDAGAQTLAWCLAIYDAFRLFGRPERMIYDQRNPFSPYFCQPIGPARGRLYFDTELIEDLPGIEDNRPREIENQYLRILVERMMRAGAMPPGPMPRAFLPAPPRQTQLNTPQGSPRQGSTGNTRSPGTERGILPASPPVIRERSASPPVLPPIGELAGGSTGALTPASDRGRSPYLRAGSFASGSVQGHQSSVSIASGSVANSADGHQRRQAAPSTPVPYMTPPLAPHSQLAPGAPVRNDDAVCALRPPAFPRGNVLQGASSTVAESQQVGDSDDLTIERIMLRQDTPTGSDSIPPTLPSKPTSRSASPQHPVALVPGNPAGGQEAKRANLADIHGGGTGSTERLDATESLQDSQQPQQGGPYQQFAGPYFNTHASRFAPAQEAETSLASPLSRESTTAGHYNSVPFRTSPPNTTNRPPAESAPNSLSSENRLPSVSGSSYPQSSTQSNAVLATSSAASIPGETVPNEPSNGSGIQSESAPGSGGGRQPVSDSRGSLQEHSILSNEPAALYALTIPEEEPEEKLGLNATQPQPPLQPIPEQRSRRQETQDDLVRIIQKRAMANGPLTPSSDGIASNVATRQNTITPISAAPTSASEYSQSGGTLIEPLRRRVIQGDHATPADDSHAAPVPAGATVGSDQHHGDRPQAAETQPGTAAGKASTHPGLLEGQDDYLAGLNYLALTSDRDEKSPKQGSAAIPPRPPRSPRGNGRPVISISTSTSPKAGIGGFADPSVDARASRDHDSRDRSKPSDPAPASEVPTPSSAEPSETLHSPDPYGASNHDSVSVARSVAMGSTSGRKVSSQSSHQTAVTGRSIQQPTPDPTQQEAQSRKPGRKGVPRPGKTGRKLGSWSSDDDSGSDSQDTDRDEEDEEPFQLRSQYQLQQHMQGTHSAAAPEQIGPSTGAATDDRRGSITGDLRSSSSSTGSHRRMLPQLPGPSTDPYINQEYLSGSASGAFDANRQSQYGDDQMQQQPAQQMAFNGRASLYGWPNQPPLPAGMPGSGAVVPSWHMSPSIIGAPRPMRPYSGQFQSPSPYSQSPSPSVLGVSAQTRNGPLQGDGMVSTIPQDPSMAGADAKAAREAAVAPHGLLQAGLQNQQARSAAQIEAQAKESGGPLLHLDHKAQAPQGGLMGAIANHEKDRKREGGIGATLTEREREKRAMEARQAEMEQMQRRQSGMFGGMPFNFGGMVPGPAGFGGVPGAGGAGAGFSMDPMQMQQQMAMLAAQNAYLQTMAMMNNPAMANPQGFMTPPFSPQPGFAGLGPQMPYQQSYLGMSQSPGGYYPHQTPPQPEQGGQSQDRRSSYLHHPDTDNRR